MAAGWKAFAKTAKDIADALANVKRSPAAAPRQTVTQSPQQLEYVRQLYRDVEAMDAVEAEEVPMAVRLIKRFRDNLTTMTPAQIEAIEPGVRRLAEQARRRGVAYRDAAGDPLPGVRFNTTVDAVDEAITGVDAKLAARAGTTAAGKNTELDEIKTMAQKLVDDMNAQATKSGAPKLNDKDLADAYQMSESLLRIKQQNDEVYNIFTNAGAVRGQISTAGVRRLGRATSGEDLDARWRSLPEGLKNAILAQEKAGQSSPIMNKGREMRARFGTPAQPPVPPQTAGGGGASPLAQRPQQPPGRPGRKRPEPPPPPEGPDGGRPRRQLPPPPDFPMG